MPATGLQQVCSRSVARRISNVLATLPSSNNATGVSTRARPARRNSPRFNVSVRRPVDSCRVRRTCRAAMVIATAARMPGTIETSIACRMPITDTNAAASSGPMIAPALSPARSTPNARP